MPNYKTLEKNIGGKNLSDLGFCDEFLEMTPEA